MIEYDLPKFNGYQMVDRMCDKEGFRIYMDKYDDLWLSDDHDRRGFCVPNDILSSIWIAVREKDTDNERLPEFVDEGRVWGGTVRCEDCGYLINFEGDETHDEARERWFSDEHRARHDGDRCVCGRKLVDQPETPSGSICPKCDT